MLQGRISSLISFHAPVTVDLAVIPLGGPRTRGGGQNVTTPAFCIQVLNKTTHYGNVASRQVETRHI